MNMSNEQQYNKHVCPTCRKLLVDGKCPDGHSLYTITFTEYPVDDHRFAMDWQCNNGRDWQRALHLVKTMIPKEARSYDADKKRWVIALDYMQTYQKIKAMFDGRDDEELADVDKTIDDSFIIKELQTRHAKLSPKMKERALYVVKAAQGLVDAKLAYCICDDLWAAHNSEDGKWYYENGQYSSYSPAERDRKAIKNAQHRLEEYLRAAQMSEWLDLAMVNEKQLFRMDMLAKYNQCCYVCKRKPKHQSQLHMHRVVPGKDGGMYVESNVVILCTKCHKRYEGETWDAIHSAAGKMSDNE